MNEQTKSRTKYRPGKKALQAAYMRLKENDQNLIDKVVKGFIDRSRKDIQVWRDSIKEMEDPMQPKRRQYQMLCKDLMIDGHLTAQHLIRKMAFLSKKFRWVDANGDENEVATKLLQKPWFRKLRKRFVETKFSGTEVGEITKIQDGEIDEIQYFPKDRIIPETKSILLTEYDFEGTSYDTPELENWIIELGEADDFGLLYKLAPQIIWKRNAQQSWADFSQLFGMPLRVATTDKRNQGEIDKIEAMLEKMGEAAQAVFPTGTQIQFVDNVKTDSFNVYDKQIDRCNSEISKAVNGVTMLSDNGSSRSQSQVHFEVHQAIIEADCTEFEEEMNFDIVHKLLNIGQQYRIFAGGQFEYDRTESLSKQDQWKIVNQALVHYEVDPDYVTKQFGFPILGPKQTTNPNFNHGPASPADQGRNLSILMGLFQPLPKNVNTCSHHSPLQGGLRGVFNQAQPDSYQSLLEKISREVFDQENKAAIPSEAYQEYARQLQDSFKNGFKPRLDAMDFNSPDNYKAAMYQANVFRFSAAGTWQDVVNLNKLRDQSDNFDQFKELTKSYLNVKGEWLRTEYNNAEAISQGAANWLTMQDNKDEFHAQYQTAGDSQVRRKHKAYDGLVVSIDDPILDKLQTPNGHNCRCEWVLIPKGSQSLSNTTAIDLSGIDKGFRYNFGKENFIYESAHNYFQEFPEVKDLDRRSFGLEPWADLDRSGDKLFNTNAIDTLEDFTREFQQQANKFDGHAAHYQDHLGRWFKADVTALKDKFKKPEQWSILEELDNVMLNPDEVWINKTNNRKHTSRYLKNFRDQLLVIETAADDDQLNITNWYLLKDLAEATIDQVRTGLLIHKPTL